jgi:hypothetical protein
VKFKLTVINDAEKTNNCNAARKFILAGTCMKVEGTKTEVDKCKLHPKIFQWPQAWTFIRSRKRNC